MGEDPLERLLAFNLAFGPRPTADIPGKKFYNLGNLATI
jgi:hypothetical protein